MDALKGELESHSQKEGVRGSQLTKVGRDKRQRDGDARQTPIIYSAARSPICTRGSLGFVFPSETAGCQFGIYGRVKAGS